MKALEYCVSVNCVRTSNRVGLLQTGTYKLKLLAVIVMMMMMIMMKIIIIIIIIIIVIIILCICFMQDICTYIPETNHVPREHCVATILM